MSPPCHVTVATAYDILDTLKRLEAFSEVVRSELNEMREQSIDYSAGQHVAGNAASDYRRAG